MSIWYLIWILSTQVVNFAFYLAVTRRRFGWARTVGTYCVGYILPFVVHILWLGPEASGGERGMADAFSYSFALCFAIWGANVLAMSRGAFGRRLFAVLVCGGHQVGAFSLGLLAMRHLQSDWAGAMLATLIMVGMGAVLILRGIPLIMRMDDDVGWRELNLLGALTFVLLFATGIWPAYVAAGDWRDIVRFLVANGVALLTVPVTLAFAKKSREVRLGHMLDNNARSLQSELRVEVVRGLMRDGRPDAALCYLEKLFPRAPQMPPTARDWCGNAPLNAILNLGQQRAQEKGVGFEVEARVPPTLNIPESDMVAMLLNLLSNAANGAAGGAVRVTLSVGGGLLFIAVSNRVSEDFKLVDGLPCERPGVGILSVSATTEKYHGQFDYALFGNDLTARVTVTLPEATVLTEDNQRTNVTNQTKKDKE